MLSTLHHQLTALLWPRPIAWAGLAAIWLVIAGLNHATPDASRRAAKHASPLAPQTLTAFREQSRLLAELLGPREAPVVDRPKPHLPRPRSQHQPSLLMV